MCTRGSIRTSSPSYSGAGSLNSNQAREAGCAVTWDAQLLERGWWADRGCKESAAHWPSLPSFLLLPRGLRASSEGGKERWRVKKEVSSEMRGFFFNIKGSVSDHCCSLFLLEGVHRLKGNGMAGLVDNPRSDAQRDQRVAWRLQCPRETTLKQKENQALR